MNSFHGSYLGVSKAMIDSAEEFVRLRNSELKEEYDRAAREEAPDAVWKELIQQYPDMKIWVVGNKTVPVFILELLSRDEDTSVRDAVARKRKTPPEVLARLARDDDSGIRYAVVCNRKTPPEICEVLLNDEWDVVAAKARQRLDELCK